MATVTANKSDTTNDPGKVADFILFSQREFLLNLSKDLSRGNISFAQFYLMSYLSNAKELTMTDIARKMGHSTAAATGLVDRLEKLGYVERMHAAEDRRKVMVSITNKGLELVNKLRGALQDRVAEAMNESSNHNVDTFVSNYRGPEVAELV